MKYIILTILAMVVSGCISKQSILPKPQEIGYRELLQYNQLWQEAIHSLTGQARVTLDSPQYSGNLDADIRLGGQDSLLVAITGPLGIDVGKVFISKSRFVFFDQVNNHIYTGSKKDFEGRNFLQFPLEVDQLRAVLTARDEFSVLKKEKFEKQDDFYYLEASNAGHNYKMWFDEDNLMLTKLEQYDDSGLVYYKEYDRFHLVNGLYFPIAINFVRPDARQGVSVYFNSLALNEQIDKADFQIKISDSARQIDLSLESNNQD